MRKLRRLLLMGTASLALLLLLLWMFVPSFNLMVSNAVRKYITGNDYPLKYFSASPAGDSVSLRWAFPYDIRFDHVEVYYSPDGPADRGSQKIEVPNQRTRFMYFSPPKKEGVHHFAAYTVDRNGAYSEPIHDTFRWVESAPFDGFITVHYQPVGNWVEGTELQFPFVRLENEYLRCYFVNGGLLGVENKHSSPDVSYNPYGLRGSYLNGMDVAEMDATGNSFDILGNWVDKSMADSAWISYKVDSNSVEATRYTLSGDAHVSLRFTLDSTTIHFELIPRNKNQFGFRFNTIGNGEFKAVTHWTANSIRAKIDEEGEDVEAMYGLENNEDYHHRDEVFNDDFPYLKSRVFLALSPHSEMLLMQDSDTLFRLHRFEGNSDFFYKNCWGEESFSFGIHWPYDKYLHTISQPFSMDIEVLH